MKTKHKKRKALQRTWFIYMDPQTGEEHMVRAPYEVYTAPDTDGWTLVWIPEIHQTTQAGHGYSIEDMAREVISLVTGTRQEDIELFVREYTHKWWE